MNKETFGDNLLSGLLLIIWAGIPALGALGAMQALEAPLWAGIGIAMVVFILYGIFDRVNEINNRLKDKDNDQRTR